MQLLNIEYCTRLEKLRTQCEITEDRFVQSHTYKLLVQQTQVLSEQLAKSQGQIQKFKELKDSYQQTKTQKEQMETTMNGEIQKLKADNESNAKKLRESEAKLHNVTQQLHHLTEAKQRLEDQALLSHKQDLI